MFNVFLFFVILRQPRSSRTDTLFPYSTLLLSHLVWLHRDPVQVAASRTMMMADIMDGIVGVIDLKAEAKMHLAMTRASIDNTMSNPLVDDPRIHNVRYSDFVAAPAGTITVYYQLFGRQFGRATV